MRWLGEHLHARGLTVCAPRLAGHGTRPAMMRRQHWMDWYESVLDGIALVRARCPKVFAVGLSMGGLLSLRVAEAGLVDGAVVMAAPLYVHAPLRLPQRGDLDARVRAIQRETGREDHGRVAYDEGTPVASIAQLRALMGEVRRHLPEITVPLLLIYSQSDRTVPFGNMQVVAEQVRSPDLVLKTLEHSDHVLTQEIEREAVYEMVWEFLSARLE
jgi:carboxylesterase